MKQFHLDEEAIFDLARRIESPELRAEYVDQACGANGELKNRIAELLMTYDREQSFLERPPAELAPTTAKSISENPGDTIGPYKLLQQIGEGGFGVVYMAEQSRPVKRKVALKIIKPGMDTKDVVARFEAERQALALMDHPNIAKVFDGGATDTGRPFFVMELVKGVTITEFCDSNKLSTRERLELFVRVCQAIQHAHQKGVIHRDIKPSNVMITLHDNRPVPKVIDFGVAKAISQELTEKTMFTTYGQMIGTPQYMSPEQAQMSGLDIDTRSDVYSLGVLLYELLTGTTPLDIERLRNTAYAELQRLICESEPPKPSTKVSGLGEQSIRIASDRGVDARKLHSLLRGDLDWIVMKALEKDRNRRFESAGSFAGDIQRYLSDQPILARPPSTAYQIRKFLRRNRAKVIASGAVMTIATLVVVGTAWMHATIEHSERNRERISEKLRSTLQQQAIEKALESLQNGNLEDLKKAIEEAGNEGASGELMDILRGRLQLEEDHPEEAIKAFNQAIAANPNSVAPLANKIVALGHLYQVDEYLKLYPDLAARKAETSHDYLFQAEAELTGSWGDYRKPLDTIQNAIDKAREEGDLSPAPFILRAKILVKEAGVSGEVALIDDAFDSIEAADLLARDKQAIVRLRFATHAEAAHVLRSNGYDQAAQSHYDEAKELLKQHPFLQEPYLDLALIQFLEYPGSNDEEVFKVWKKMVFDQGQVGGAAGMYGLCAIRQGKKELDTALEKLQQIDEKHHSADLNCQLGLMAIHAGDRDLAEAQYHLADKAKSPLVRLDGQLIALLLGDRASVARCCEELGKDPGRMSKWARFDWEIMSGELADREALLDRAKADRHMAVEGLICLALTKLADGRAEKNPDKIREARELLEEAAGRRALYFAHYVAAAILYDWERNPDWPTAMAKTDVDVHKVGN